MKGRPFGCGLLFADFTLGDLAIVPDRPVASF